MAAPTGQHDRQPHHLVAEAGAVVLEENLAAVTSAPAAVRRTAPLKVAGLDVGDHPVKARRPAVGSHPAAPSGRGYRFEG
jgi:hypothetical protein